MKKEKIILLIIALLVTLMICIIGLILVLNNTKEEIEIAADEPSINIEIQDKLERVTDINSFYIVESCIESFYRYHSEIFDETYEGYIYETEEDKEKIKAQRIETVYKLLDAEYIEHEGITLENLTSKLPKMDNTYIIIKDMYCIEQNERISAYFAYGTAKSDFSIMVKVDFRNRTYKLLLGDKVETYYKDLQNGKELTIEEEISNDEYNTFSYENITEKEYINDLFSHYKKSLRLGKEESYNLLDEKYKKTCFENTNDYLSYINHHYSRITTARLDEYGKEEKKGYTEYLFKDKKGNYYTFKETAPFKYSVILDNYTIPTDEFVEEYKASSEGEKLVLNIKQFFMGIDDKNYGYSYSVLSEAFKNNKYPTKNDFINYAKQNFFEENEIQYISYKKENGLYIYEIVLTDATGSSLEERTLSIIMKLNNGTDFEMSFSSN